MSDCFVVIFFDFEDRKMLAIQCEKSLPYREKTPLSGVAWKITCFIVNNNVDLQKKTNLFVANFLKHRFKIIFLPQKRQTMKT